MVSKRAPDTHASGPVKTSTSPVRTVPSTTRIRPDAIAAAHIPNTNGVTIDAMPNTRVHVRCHAVPGSPCARNAKAAPRMTMPATAMPSGT
jgi:hypothetical protein